MVANNNLGGVPLRKYILILIALVIVSGVFIYTNNHRLEKLARDNGFEFTNAGNYSEYVGYYYNFESTDSQYCGSQKSASIYTRVKSYLGNKIYYYCDSGNGETYEYEYDFDTKELKLVSGSSMFSTELTVNKEESAKYQEVYLKEFNEFNDNLKKQWEN